MDLGITNKYYNKQDIIDINRLKLCFLTEYLIEWKFIKMNDINLLGYDDFLIKLLSEYKDEYKLVIKVVNYVVKRIKSNKYLDEEGNEIRNLLSYFISSCESNITMLKENDIEESDIVSIQFTTTPDLTKLNPAAALRRAGYASNVPLFCSLEPVFENSLKYVIRCLILAYSKEAGKSVYLNDAEVLRPDLAKK